MRWNPQASSRPGRRGTARPRRSRPAIERLDVRVMPAITLPTPGDPGPVLVAGTEGDDLFVIRRDPEVPANLQVSDDGGQTFRSVALEDVTRVDVTSPGGHDRLVIDHSAGLVGSTGGLAIRFDGGPGGDTLVQRGAPAGATLSQVYAAGAVTGSGTLSTTDGTRSVVVEFPRLERVVDSVPAASLTILGNDNANVMEVVNAPPIDGQAAIRVLAIDRTDLKLGVDRRARDNFVDVADEATVPIDFTNKSAVTVDGRGGDDSLALNAMPSAGLSALNFVGGDGRDGFTFKRELTGVAVDVADDVEVRSVGGPAAYTIQALYSHELGRGASPEEEAGWAAIFQQQGAAAVARGILLSPEARAYQARVSVPRYFGPQANPSIGDAYRDALQRGVADEGALADFLLTGGAPNDSDFVRFLYQATLQREPSEQEVAGWREVVGNTGRRNAALGFIRSEEFRTNQVSAYYWNILHRAPDAEGLARWVAPGRDLFEIRTLFWTSPEFLGS